MSATKHDYRADPTAAAIAAAGEIAPGTYTVTFPRGMHQTDFTKCLAMARRLGRYDGRTKTWTITVQGTHGQASVREMIDRGAEVTAA